jgi:uncharacterized membrane protein
MHDRHHHVSDPTKMAVSATLHCLTGCAIGEILGMVIGSAWGLSNSVTVIISIALAFVFGYSLSLFSVLRSGVPLKSALRLVLIADTLSIMTMEIVDNAVILVIPGAMDAHFTDWFFWMTMAISLVVAFIVTVPVNRWLIINGKGHARLHEHHH